VSQLNRRNIEVERDKNSTGQGLPQYHLPELPCVNSPSGFNRAGPMNPPLEVRNAEFNGARRDRRRLKNER